MEIVNATTFAALAVDAMAADGAHNVHVTIVGAFTLGGACAGPATIVERDDHAGEPGASPLVAIGDLGWTKPGTDVLVYADALAPGGGARACEVSLSVGPVAKMVRVIGDREWKKRLFGVVASDPRPFTVMPLSWDRAFGGTVTTRSGALVTEERNPIGRGLTHPDCGCGIAGTPLPNLEDPRHPLISPGQRPSPAGFAPVSAHWQPRRGFAGTYDKRWKRTRAPLLPEDFDERFLHCAPTDQIVPGHLSGGEEVMLDHIAPLGSYRFALPGIVPVIAARTIDGVKTETVATLQTVALRPGKNRIDLTWRAKCGGELAAIERITIDIRTLSAVVI
jgi:hypothetical protein